MTDPDLGTQPDPSIEPGEHNPGGTDAAPEPEDSPVSRDLSPDENPAVDDVLPDSVAQPDDKQQEPDESRPDSGDEDGDDDPEPPA